MRLTFKLRTTIWYWRDVLSKEGNRLFPDCGLLIYEAHKLLDAARQMYGMTLESVELERLTSSIYRSIGSQNPDKGEILRLCEEMPRQNTALFENLKNSIGMSYDKNCSAVEFRFDSIQNLKALQIDFTQTVSAFLYQRL